MSTIDRGGADDGLIRLAKGSTIRRAYQVVAEDLARLIQVKYEVGDKLPAERDLAQRYAVSRPTIREALLALSLAGLIEIRSKGGVYVIQRQTTTDIRSSGIGPFETIEARLLIEPEVTAIATSKATEALIAELAASLAQMQQANAEGKDANAGDHRFHLALATATGNGMLVAVCDHLWRAQFESHIWNDIHRHMRIERYWKIWRNDHEQIFTAVQLGSPIQARIAMIRHLENIREVLLTRRNSAIPKGTVAPK